MNQELILVWHSPYTLEYYPIGILSFTGTIYTYHYLHPSLEEAQNAGFTYVIGFKETDKEYISVNLFANFESRLPNTQRAGYKEMLAQLGLNETSSKFDILKATRGHLFTDNYEFVTSLEELEQLKEQERSQNKQDLTPSWSAPLPSAPDTMVNDLKPHTKKLVNSNLPYKE